ncbi:MAG: response regulator [Verrucomicrobia bacterium]|nr:response regulator [Verrucomicrobiota bacterium]
MSFPATVLLADDEPHIRKYVSLILRQLGATRLIEAANGEEAVALFEREKPDMVLLDVNMPTVDGLEALRRIHALDPNSVVVMLTSLSTRQTVEAALEHGAANYIRKDTPREELSRVLRETVAVCFGGEASP